MIETIILQELNLKPRPKRPVVLPQPIVIKKKKKPSITKRDVEKKIITETLIVLDDLEETFNTLDPLKTYSRIKEWKRNLNKRLKEIDLN
jgi:transposase